VEKKQKKMKKKKRGGIYALSSAEGVHAAVSTAGFWAFRMKKKRGVPY